MIKVGMILFGSHDSAGTRLRGIRINDCFNWLESDYGFDRWEALQLLSQVGCARVANVVDPNYTIVAKFPKKYLPDK